jgi:hypothetical protein
MTEKLMIYVFLRPTVTIDPANPEKVQHFTRSHVFPVPAEDANADSIALLDRYGFDSLDSEVKEEMNALGYTLELSWDVIELVTPTPEEWAASESERTANLSGPLLTLLCAPTDTFPVDEAAADRAASAVILGEPRLFLPE